MNSDCPSSELLEKLLEGGVGGETESIVESHVRICPRCQERLDLLTRIPAVAQAANRDREWTDSHSGVVIRRVATALSHESKHGSALSESPHFVDSTADETPLLAIPGYDIRNRIGTGGSSDVFRAFHKQLRRDVALKIIRERALPEQRDRFRREAEALAKLRHPGIVQIYETGQVNGSIFMSLEFEAGGSLSQFLSGAPQPALESARFISAAATAIHAAHGEGLIHRDLKPGNLLLHSDSGRHNEKSLAAYSPKVTDFGLVKQIAEISSLTASRDILGTPSYMAPEQVTHGDRPIGPAADIYALGAVLYEMLTGRSPFRAATAIDTVIQVRYDQPVPPSRLTPSIPRDLETICLKCLEKEPSRRYSTAADLTADLTRFVEGRPVKARPIHWPIRIARWTRRNPRTAFLSAAVFFLLTSVAILGPIIAYRQAALRKNAEDAEVRALAQWDRADRNLLAANEAIWQATMLKVAELDRSTEPDASLQQKRIIENAMPILDKARARDPDLPTHRLRWGVAMLFHGRAARRSNDWPRAEADLREASTVLGRLAVDLPENSEIVVFDALVQLEQAHLAVLLSKKNAELIIRETLSHMQRTTERFAQSPEAWHGLVESYQLLADLLEKKSAPSAEYADTLQKLAETLKKIDSYSVNQSHNQEAEVVTRLRLAKYHRATRDLSHSESTLRDAVAAAERTPRGGTATPNLMALRSQSANLLAEYLATIPRIEEAILNSRYAVRVATILTELSPGDKTPKVNLVQCQLTLANAYVLGDNASSALEVLDQVSAISRSISLPPSVVSRYESLLVTATKQNRK